MGDLNPVHQANVDAKALRIAEQMRATGDPAVNSRALSKAGDAEWARIFAMFGEANSQPHTRKAIVKQLRVMEALAARQNASDVFAGLPS